MLRIALAYPYAWPQVRRGAERFIDDLGRYLTARGHDVTVITSSPRGVAVEGTSAVRRIVFEQWRPPALLGRRLTSAHFFPFQCRGALARGGFDVVHCLSQFDAFAGALASRSGTRYVFQSPGIPLKRAFRTVPHDYLMFRCALARAASVLVVSRFAGAMLKRDFGVAGEVLLPPVDLEHFQAPADARREPDLVLMSGALDEERKGAALLMRAFPLVKRAAPRARLRLTGQIAPDRERALLALLPDALRSDVEMLGAGERASLPRLYAQAGVTVLPAVWEALGMVLVEALACGSAVVGADHAGIPEVIGSPEVGVLFPPGSDRREATNASGLADAIVAAIGIARRPETAERCRAHAQPFGWAVLGPRYEDLYQRVARG